VLTVVLCWGVPGAAVVAGAARQDTWMHVNTGTSMSMSTNTSTCIHIVCRIFRACSHDVVVVADVIVIAIAIAVVLLLLFYQYSNFLKTDLSGNKNF